MTKQIDGRKRSERTDNCGEDNQPQVVGEGDAIIDFEHGIP
jgi:hypothetical protein